jgi:hypothetical protein
MLYENGNGGGSLMGQASHFAGAAAVRRSGLAAGVAGLLALAFLVATFQLGFEKNLVRTIAPEEWGRYLFAISSAITELKSGIGWFASSEYVEGALQQGGLTADPSLLKPLGLQFPENLKHPQVLQNALEKAWAVPHAPSNRPEAGGYYNNLRGAMGDDAGLSTYTVLGFVLFGRHIASLYYLYFAVLAASMLLYALSHGRSVAAVTGLALAVMGLYLVASSDVVNFTRTIGYFAGQSGLDIKDPRFLSTLALVPVVHIVAWWLSPGRPFGAFDLVVLAGQAAILAFAIHIRASAQWTVIGLGVLWLVVAADVRWRQRLPWSALMTRGRSYSLVTLATCAIVLGMGHVVPLLAAHPLYKLQGDRVAHPFWRGVYYSLQDNPDWTAKYSATVDGASGDEMPVVAVKKAIAKLPPDQQRRYLVRGYPTMVALEKFSRSLFFHLLRQDPRFIYRTYFVFRRMLIGDRIGFFYQLQRETTTMWQILALSGAMLALVVAAVTERSTVPFLASFAAVAGFFSLVALLPNWLVSVENTLMMDHFCWALTFLAALAALAGVIVARTARWLGRLVRARLRPAPGIAP